MTRQINIDIIPKEMRAKKHWAVWKTEENEHGRKQRVSYYTHKKQADVNKPRTWTTFDKAVIILTKYPEYEGLSYIKPTYLGTVGRGCQNTVIEETVYKIYFKIRNRRTFLKYKCPFRGDCQ